MNRHERRATNSKKANKKTPQDHVTCERRFKDGATNLRVIVDVGFDGDLGISLWKGNVLLEGCDG